MGSDHALAFGLPQREQSNDIITNPRVCDTYPLTGNSYNVHREQHPRSIEQRSSKAGTSHISHVTNSTLAILQNLSHPSSSHISTTVAQPTSVSQPFVHSGLHITLIGTQKAHVKPSPTALTFSMPINSHQKQAAEAVVLAEESFLDSDISNRYLRSRTHTTPPFRIFHKYNMDPCSSLPIYEDPPVVPPTAPNQQNYIAVWKGRDNTLLHGGIYDTLVHGKLDKQARCEAKQLFTPELPIKSECQKPPSVFDSSSTSSEELFTIPTISTDGYQEIEWKVTNGIKQLKSCENLSEKDDIHISTRVSDQLRSLEAVVEIGRQKNITLMTKSALDYVEEYKQLKTRFSHGDINLKSDVSVFMPYARLPSPCDIVPGWQLDFDALNNLILPLRHRIPSIIPYYERIEQCYKKMEDMGKRLEQDYNKALDALLQSHVTKIDLDDALAQPATSQHEIARLQKIYNEAQATYQDWIHGALQFETFMLGENGRAFVKLTDDFVKLVLPLTISVTNGGLDDQSVEFSIAAQDQAFRDRKKEQEKALKHAPREQERQKVINLNHSSSDQFNGNNYECRDAVRAPDCSKYPMQKLPETLGGNIRLCQEQERVPVGRMSAPQVPNMRPSRRLVPQGSGIVQVEFVGPFPNIANGFAVPNSLGSRFPGWNEQHGSLSDFPRRQPSYNDPSYTKSGLNMPESLRYSSLDRHIQHSRPQFYPVFTNIASNNLPSLKRTLNSTTPHDTEERRTKRPCVD